MSQINIFVQSLKKTDSGFITDNNFKLKYTLPESCCVKDLLNTVNQFKSPKNQVKILLNSEGKFIPNELLINGSIYFIK